MKTPWQKGLDDLRANGPNSVLINEQGDVVTTIVARKIHDLAPEIILLRDDGWSLGAPMHLSEVALALWKDEWTCYMVDGDNRIFGIPAWRFREQHLDAAQKKKRDYDHT